MHTNRLHHAAASSDHRGTTAATRSHKTFVMVLLSVALVCGGGGWIAWRFSDLGQASAELDQAIVAAKAAGLPWLASDLRRGPSPSERGNAAGAIRRAMRVLGGDRACAKALAALDAAMTRGDDVEPAPALAQLLPIAREAGERTDCDFDRDWDAWIWLRFPEFSCEKQMVKLLCAESEREATIGDPRAVDDLRRAIRLGSFAGREPVLVGMLVSIACDAAAMRTAERLIDVWHANPAMLGAIEQVLKGAGPEPDFVYAMKGECYAGIAINRNIRNFKQLRTILVGDSGESPEDLRRPKEPVRSGVPGSVFGRIFMCRHLQMWTRIMRRVQGLKDPMKMGAVIEAVTREEEHKGWSHFMNQSLMPAFSQAGTAFVRMTAARATTLALVRVLRFKAAHGRYPSCLGDAGAPISDPFADRALRYKVLGDECRVYSVGPDGTDDGGVRQAELPTAARHDQGYDLVASFPAYRARPSTKRGR